MSWRRRYILECMLTLDWVCSFDRVMTIEMMEHMKNYEAIFHKISTWLKPNKEAKTGEALLFVHIFCHKDTPYVLLPLLD